jgi:hypothetical protein
MKAARLGYNRVYVKLDGPFSYDSWFQASKAGRSFGTNGPMLFLTVDGEQPRDLLRLPNKGRRTVRVRVEVSSRNPMNRLEVILKGRTVPRGPAMPVKTVAPLSVRLLTE